ncbi:MAG TPA: cation diffusion facilitator family transporter [Chitinophagaceae bacterium]|jgi:cation diffusion facilitator family transporter
MASSKLPVYSALVSDLAIAVSKFIAAAVTGSSAMISEGIHSVIDSINQILLLIGIRSSKKKPDENRPFGYGKELYFWSFVVSLLIFSLGGGVSFYEGIVRLYHPVNLENASWNYIVLAIGFAFTIFSVIITLKAFNKQRGDTPFWEAIKQSKDPSTFIVLLQDVGDLLGLIVAFLGVYFGHLFNNSHSDGIASIVIGLILMAISGVLVRESRSLLMGETAGKKTLRDIVKLTEADPSVIKVKRHFSMYMAPEEIVLQLITVFKDGLTTSQIAEAIERIQKNIKRKYPRFKQIFIEPGLVKK